MTRELTLGKTLVGDDHPCFVIAEIGHNHQGNLDTAIEMMKTAKNAGANAVKLQKRNNKTLFTKAFFDSPYTGRNSYGSTYGKHREALEFGHKEYKILKEYAEEIGVEFFSTAFDIESSDFLEELGMPFYKIASADLTNLELLRHVAEFGKPMIVSTGGATMDDVQRAYDTMMPINTQFALLQCTAAYPVERYEEMNLKVVETYRNAFPNTVVGLSDHESGIGMALAAWVLGGRIVEKHFTLNRAWRGTDQSFSLSPSGLKKMIRNIRRLEAAMGDGIKRVMPSEKKPIGKMTKKIVAAKNLPKGHVLTEQDIALRCSYNGGLPASHYRLILGRPLAVSLQEDDGVDAVALGLDSGDELEGSL